MSTSKFYISTDVSKMNIEFIHEYLSAQSYWAKGRSREDVEKSMRNSLCFAVLNEVDKQVGFARVATDYVVFSWLMDVFIDENYKGKGLGSMLLNFISNYAELKQVNGIGLKTKDAHDFYDKFGFSKIDNPDVWMFRKNNKEKN